MKGRIIHTTFFIGIAFYPLIVNAYTLNLSDGDTLHWYPDGRPIIYSLNVNGAPNCDGEQEAVDRAALTWQNVATSKIVFQSLPPTSIIPIPDNGPQDLDDKNVLYWAPDWEAIDPNPDHRYAGAKIWHYGLHIFEFDIFYNAEYHPWSASENDYCPTNSADVEGFTAHEFGHLMGLAEIDEIPGHHYTMASAHWTGETQDRTLDQDDIAGASYHNSYNVTWLDPGFFDLLNGTENLLDCSIAMSWNPYQSNGETKPVYLHGAAKLGPANLSALSSDGGTILSDIITPVKVVYACNATPGWSWTTDLSTQHNNITGPQVAIDKNDNVYVIWSERDQNVGRTVCKKRTATSGGGYCWEPEQVISTEVPAYSSPAIAVDFSPASYYQWYGDNVFAAWVDLVKDNNGVPNIYQLFVSRSVNGVWEPKHLLANLPTADGCIIQPQIALDSLGGVHVAAIAHLNDQGAEILMYTNEERGDPQATWWPNLTIPELSETYTDLSMAIDGYGNIHLVYIDVESDMYRAVRYIKIPDLGSAYSCIPDGDVISPEGRLASNPRVACDDLGRVHFFWADNREHANQANPYKKDVYYCRNLHMGDLSQWDPNTKTGSQLGKKVNGLFDLNVWPDHVCLPDTFGEVLVAVGNWESSFNGYDLFGAALRQDDMVRSWPDPFNMGYQSSPLAVKDAATAKESKQGCYISGSVNQLAYFAPTECRLSYFSIDGRLVKTENVNGAGITKPAGLPSGVYFARIQSGDGTSKQAKVVIVN